MTDEESLNMTPYESKSLKLNRVSIVLGVLSLILGLSIAYYANKSTTYKEEIKVLDVLVEGHRNEVKDLKEPLIHK